MAEKKLQIYVSNLGKDYFTEWFDSLKDKKVISAVRVRLSRIQCGNFGNSRPVGNGVWELKMNIGPGFRVYYGQVNEEIILILCGGDKASQQKDIEKAKLLWREYRN